MTTAGDSDLVAMAAAVLERCRREGLCLATAESCTGGLVTACLTAVAGSSDVLERGFVTYSNAAKAELLDVAEDLMVAHGAVSEPVARAMAKGALARARADLALSVTGIAGPGGATADKPVGLVHIAAARRGGEAMHERHVFPGDRAAVRKAAVAAALRLLGRVVTDQP